MVEPSDNSTMGTRLTQFGNDIGIQEVPVHLNSKYWPPSRFVTFWNQVLKSNCGSQQQGFETGTRSVLQTVPFTNRYQHRGFNPAASNDLWPSLDGCVQEFTESRFRVLNLP